MLTNLIYHTVALDTVQGLDHELHDTWIGVHLEEGLQIIVPPLTQDETRREQMCS
jgi:hypothetical protein